MPTPVCPSCRADLEEDLVASTGKAECPFCGANLSGVEFAPADEVVEYPTEDAADEALPESESFEDEDAEVDESEEVESPPSVLGVDRPLPPKSSIQVVESTGDRRVIFVPPGGATAGLGFFAIVWNGFMLIFTAALAAGFKQKGNDAPIPILILFLGLFWSVGLGFLYFWIRLRFTRTILMLDREQLIVQRTLFGRKKMTETQISPDSRATLVVAYEQNKKPVHSVSVVGLNRTEKFGTALTREEKDWFVDTINGFLGSHGIRAACEEILEKSGGEVVAPLAPTALPASSEIVVDRFSEEQLTFHLPLLPRGSMRKFVGCGGIGVLLSALIPHAILLITGVQVGFLMHALFFVLPGIVLFSFLFAWVGRLTVELTRERLLCRWHWRRYGMRKRLATPAITRIALLRDVVEKRGERSQRPVGGPNSTKVCLVFAGKDSVALTTLHDVETARQAGGMVRYLLEEMGFQVEDV